MSPAARLSPLDGERFGITVARAEAVGAADVGELLAFCARHSVDLAIARCDADDDAAAAALLASGFELCEVQAHYRGPLPAPSRRPSGVRQATASDRDALAAVARRCFADFPGHYHADRRLSRDACRDLYVDWTLRCLDSTADTGVFVTEGADGIAAFSAYTHARDAIVWTLAGSDPDARGPQQLAILPHAVEWALERGARQFEATMPDIRARHRYAVRCGLARIGRTATFHGWPRLG